MEEKKVGRKSPAKVGLESVIYKGLEWPRGVRIARG